jgi:hypothetical protein
MEVLVGGLFCVEDMSLTGQLWSWQVSPAECGLAVVSELACQLVAQRLVLLAEPAGLFLEGFDALQERRGAGSLGGWDLAW